MRLPAREIESVRAFNRFYTKHLGLLRESYLASGFSLTQARVLYELGSRSGSRSTELADVLNLDPGYLSRVLKRFQQKRLISRAPAKEDGRISNVSLTAHGRSEFEKLNSRSQAEVGDVLAGVDRLEQEQLVAAMKTIESILGRTPLPTPDIVLRSHRPGDIGWVIARHGELYAQEYEWDSTFEGLVAEIAGKFLTHFDRQREKCWIAERNGDRLGCVFLVKQSKSVAKLRLLLVEPSARGLGIGGALVAECITFARESGYRKLTLWTNDILTAARNIYEKAGFRLVKEEKHHSFGHDLVGQFWELELR